MWKLGAITGSFLLIFGTMNPNSLAAPTEDTENQYNSSGVMIKFPKDGLTPNNQGSIAFRGGTAADFDDDPAFVEACSLDPEKEINWGNNLPKPDSTPFYDWFLPRSTAAGKGGWVMYPPKEPTFKVLWVEQAAGAEPITLEIVIAPLKFFALCTFQTPITGPPVTFVPGRVRIIHIFNSKERCGDDPLPCERPNPIYWPGHGNHLIVRSTTPNHGYKIVMTPPTVGRFGMFIGGRIFGSPKK